VQPRVAPQEDQVEDLRFEQSHGCAVRFDGLNSITLGLQKGHSGRPERAIVSDYENALWQWTIRI
jgi:hypothetical protein